MKVMLRPPLLFDLWRREFGGYSRDRFARDLVAGLTGDQITEEALMQAMATGSAADDTGDDDGDDDAPKAEPA